MFYSFSPSPCYSSVLDFIHLYYRSACPVGQAPLFVHICNAGISIFPVTWSLIPWFWFLFVWFWFFGIRSEFSHLFFFPLYPDYLRYISVFLPSPILVVFYLSVIISYLAFPVFIFFCSIPILMLFLVMLFINSFCI